MVKIAPRALLNLDAIEHSIWHTEPFPWSRYQGAIVPAPQAEQLRNSFPEDSFTRFSRESGSKRHRLLGRRLDINDEALTKLPTFWRHFLVETRSPAYREAMERAARISLAGLDIEVTLWRHGPGDFIDPHVDNEGKVLVHLLFFSSADWRSSDGGCLRILRSNRLTDIHVEIEPCLGEAVIFRRTATSWHGYPPVVRSDEPRLAVQIVFHKSWMKYSEIGDNTPRER